MIERAISKGKNSNDDDGKSDRRSDVYRGIFLVFLRGDELSDDVFIFLTNLDGRHDSCSFVCDM